MEIFETRGAVKALDITEPGYRDQSFTGGQFEADWRPEGRLISRENNKNGGCRTGLGGTTAFKVQRHPAYGMSRNFCILFQSSG